MEDTLFQGRKEGFLVIAYIKMDSGVRDLFSPILIQSLTNITLETLWVASSQWSLKKS